MIVLVTGPRVWKDVGIVERALLPYVYPTVTLRHGGAAGLDTIAMRVGKFGGMIVEPAWKPDYATHGYGAPFQRNEAMVLAGVDVCLAFLMPCPAGEACPKFAEWGLHYTHGTRHCMNFALKQDVRVEWFTETDSWKNHV